MKFLLNNLLILSFLLFASEGFSQSDTSKSKSAHPLLDKYYPKAKTDTVVTVLPKNTGVDKPSSKSKIENKTAVPDPVVLDAPVMVVPPKDSVVLPAVVQLPAALPSSNVKIETGTVSVPVVLPSAPPGDIKEDSILPVSTAAISDGLPNTLINGEINPISTKKAIAPVNKPTAASTPENKKTPVPAYQRPRLGSSSPLYRTWEKNNNGAGSVTTLPKG